ncbi:MAG: M20/M25/M40 family metallo-hydrolase, partial [Acidobacteriales bacterium]
AEAGAPLPSFPLPGVIRAEVSVNSSEASSDNVAGILRGRHARLRQEYVVVSAHLDHLGTGAAINGDSIYNGAMDDAAGVASLLEIARLLKASAPRRSVIFVAVTGEEEGLLGSRHFAASPPVDRQAIVADLNLDMFQPLHALRLLTVYGLDGSSLGRDVRAVARQFGVGVQGDQAPERNLFVRSDHDSFIRAGIPSLSFQFGFTKGSREEMIQNRWLKERYHAPSDDTAQPVDLAAAARFNRLIAALASRIANQPQRPQWNANSFFRRFARSGN